MEDGTRKNAELRIDDEFRKLLPEPPPSVRRELARSLRADGCLDPLEVWQPDDEEARPPILLDGHTRREICDNGGIGYELRERQFASREDAKAWVISKHLGRRHLGPAGRCEVATSLRPLLDAAAEARRRRGARRGGRAEPGGAENLPRKSAEPSAEEGSEAESIVEAMLREHGIPVAGEAREQAARLVRVGRDTYANYQSIKDARHSEEELPKVRERATELYDDLTSAAPEFSISGAHSELKRFRGKEKRKKAEADRRAERERRLAGGEDDGADGGGAPDQGPAKKGGALLGRTPRRWREGAPPVWIRGAFQDYVEQIPNGTVRLLLTDPPYGSGHEDFGGDESPEKAAGLLREMFRRFENKLAEDCHVVFFCGVHQHMLMRRVLDEAARPGGVLAGFVERDPLVWMKSKPGSREAEAFGMGLGDPYSFAPTYEFALHASRGEARLKPRNDGGYISPKIPTDTHDHSAAKPLGMLRRIIQATTGDEDVVADPFGGTASTLVAAVHGSRRGWGCEPEPGHHTTGSLRIKEALSEMEVARRTGVAPAGAFELLLRAAGAPDDELAPLPVLPDDPLGGLPHTIWGFGEPPEGFLQEADWHSRHSLGANYYIRYSGISSGWREIWRVHAEIDSAGANGERVSEPLGTFESRLDAEEAVREHAGSARPAGRGERVGVWLALTRDETYSEIPGFWDR